MASATRCAEVELVHRRGPGRPRIMREISQLMVRIAQENPCWDYGRIQGALSKLNHRVGRRTVANVPKRSGIEPAPDRGKCMPWSNLSQGALEDVGSQRLLYRGVWTGGGLVMHYLLFVTTLVDRAVVIVGITTRPDEAWMLQAGRHVTDCESGALRAKQYLMIDRDSK